MREFKIIKDPNECGNLYYKSSISFEPGVTVLIGCNGCGKTSLIRQIKHRLEKEEAKWAYADFITNFDAIKASAAPGHTAVRPGMS